MSKHERLSLVIALLALLVSGVALGKDFLRERDGARRRRHTQVLLARDVGVNIFKLSFVSERYPTMKKAGLTSESDESMYQGGKDSAILLKQALTSLEIKEPDEIVAKCKTVGYYGEGMTRSLNLLQSQLSVVTESDELMNIVHFWLSLGICSIDAQNLAGNPKNERLHKFYLDEMKGVIPEVNRLAEKVNLKNRITSEKPEAAVKQCSALSEEFASFADALRP